MKGQRGSTVVSRPLSHRPMGTFCGPSERFSLVFPRELVSHPRSSREHLPSTMELQRSLNRRNGSTCR